MSSFCKVELVGKIGKDIETKSYPNGKILIFKVGVINKYKAIQWHKVTVKGSLVPIVESYIKPDHVALVHGDLIIDKWEDANGDAKLSFEVDAKEVFCFLPQKSGKYENSQG